VPRKILFAGRGLLMGGPVFTEPVEGIDDGIKRYAVHGLSERGGYGVIGRSVGYSYSNSKIGVLGESDSGVGVEGFSSSGVGMWGSSYSGLAVIGISYTGAAVMGSSNSNFGVWGGSLDYIGVSGASDMGTGVDGISRSGDGVVGQSLGIKTYGVRGRCDNGYGVYGGSKIGYGVIGFSNSGYGVMGFTHSGYAAYLGGNVVITGNLQKGGGSFKIDHPLDPANKYLHHSFVESPDMKNVYDGMVALDNKGEAEIELPDWFGALNKDFRYQLTAMGAPGPNLYIAEEISDTSTTTNYSSDSSSSNQNNNNNSNDSSNFKIAGGTSGMKVSWQVTGIRKDPWANANRIRVEEDKPAKERGYYIYPDLYGQPEEKGISRLLYPEEEKWQEVPVK
jgi:hypothetical protein